MAPYDPQKHHRRSMRLKGYNYARPGAYFVTLVSYHRENIFGQIVKGQIHYSALGQIAHDEWMRSINLRREICLNEDEFVVMPNHIHGIVWIVDPDGEGGPIEPVEVNVPNDPVGADGVRPEEGARLAPQPGDTRPGDPQPGDPRPDDPQPKLKRAPRSLSSFIAGFKSAVTSRAGKELDVSGIWQRNYYDHIIRNEREFHRIWEYIDTNPQRWEQDQLNIAAQAN